MYIERWMDAKVEDLEKLNLGVSITPTVTNQEITGLVIANYETGARLQIRKDSWSMKVEIPQTVDKWQITGTCGTSASGIGGRVALYRG